MADPGFPEGRGRQPRRRGADSRRGYVSKSGPRGGRRCKYSRVNREVTDLVQMSLQVGAVARI